MNLRLWCQGCGRFLLRFIDCSNRPDDRPDFPFGCLHVLTENPSLNPAVYCRPWFFSLYVLLHCRSSIGFAPWSCYSELAVISCEENCKLLQRKPYKNSGSRSCNFVFCSPNGTSH